jgi:hypothetical protein
VVEGGSIGEVATVNGVEEDIFEFSLEAREGESAVRRWRLRLRPARPEEEEAEAKVVY